MRPEDLGPADVRTALKIFSNKVDVWVKLTQCVPQGLTEICPQNSKRHKISISK